MHSTQVDSGFRTTELSKSAYGVKERVNWRENDWLVSVPRLAILPGGFLTMTKRISSRYS